MGTFSQDAYLDSLARKYRESLGGAGTNTAPPTPVSGLLGDGTDNLRSARPAVKGKDKTPTNPVGWVIDILSRPSYAVGQTIRETKNRAEDGFDLADAAMTFNPVNLAQNIFSNEKETPSQVLFEDWVPQEGPGGSTMEASNKAGASFLTDVLLDPLMLVPGAAVARAGTKIGKATGLAKEGITTARKAKPAEEVIEEVPVPVGAVADAAIENTPSPTAVAPSPTETVTPEPAIKPTVPEATNLPPILAALLADLGTDTKAVAAAKKVTEGKFVPKPTAETAAELNTARVVEGIEQPRTALKNVKSGEVVPFSQRLANLTTARKQYPNLEVKSPFVAAQADEVAVPVKVETPSPATSVPTPKEWAEANKKRKVEITSEGIKWLDTKDPDALTLAEALRSKSLKPQISALYRNDTAPQAIADAPPSPRAGVERTAAVEAARARSEAIPSLVRLDGPAWDEFKKDLASKVSREDYTRLIRQKKPESFNKVLEEIKARKIRVPVYVPVVMDITPEQLADDVAKSVPVPESIDGVPTSKRREPKTTPLRKAAIEDQAAINAAKTDLPTVNQRMPNIAPESPNIAAGEGLDEAAGAAVVRALQGQQWDGIKADFQWRSSIQQSLRNSPIPGKGNAVNRNSANVMFQVNMYRGLVSHYSKLVPEGVAGMNRGDWLYKNMMPSMRAGEEFLKANGIMPVGSVLKEGYPISLSEVIDGLWTTRHGKEFVKGRIFDTGGISPRGLRGIYGTIDPTSLMGAAHLIAENLGKAVDVKDAETLRAALNKLIKPGDFRTSVEKALKGERGVTSRKGEVPEAMQAVVIAQGADLFMQPEIVAHIFDRVMENTARYGVKFNTEVAALSNKTIQSVVDILREPLTSTGEAMRVLTNTDDVVEGFAKTDGVADEFADGAKEAVKDSLTDVVKVQDVTSAQNRTKISETMRTGDREKVKAAAQKTYLDDSGAAASAAPIAYTMNLADNTELHMQAGILGKLAPLMMKLNPAWGNATLHSAITTGGSVAKLLQKQWRHELSIINRDHTKDELGNAIKWLQAGNDVHKAPAEFKAAAIRLAPVFSQIFETDRATGTSGVLSAFFREGFDVQHINDKLKYVYRDVDIDAPQFTPKMRDKKVWVTNQRTGQTYQKRVQEPYYDAEVYEQWRGWDISKDPLDFMARMETAFSGLATDMAIAQEGFRIASSLGYASKTRQAGMVQVGDQAQSIIARYMPKDAWFDPEILGEIKRMDEILSESMALNSPFGKFVTKWLDPILNMWKSGMTVWRPGHHVRNFIGDSALSFYAHGVSNPEYYIKAARMQTLRGEYDGWSALRALQQINRVPSGNAKDAVDIVVKIKGKKVKFSDRDIHQGIMDRGGLPDFRVQEDLLESGNNPAIQKLQERLAVTGGRVKGVVGRISEARDDTVRLAHAIHLLENGITRNPKIDPSGPGFDSLEDALDKVVAQVKKYHPDGADLTGFERNTMRRLMPFYSWSRKAFPLIAETMLTQPGRVLMFPKATAAYAEANGIDIESLSNPFPDDQLFPSFIEDRSTGPIYKNDDREYFGFSPGMPAMDILDDFVGNPKAGFIGMLNPFLKAPAELATGYRADSGAKINDTSEYFDSQIPGVSTFSSMSGVSFLGTPGSILQGNGLDEQRAVERGNKGHFDPESILNYFTGVGGQNFSKPSYINIAEMELRDQEAARKAKLREQ